MAQLKTLDRGIAALKLIAERPGGLSMAQLAMGLGVHKAIAYRIVTTLEAQGFVARAAQGKVVLGGGLLAVAERFEPQFRAAAEPLIEALARELSAASCIAVAEGSDCMVMMVREPEEGFLRVAYRIGSRHPLTRGATGIALLAGRPPQTDEPAAVREARRLGYSITRGQLQRGAIGLAAPVLTPDIPRGAIEPCVGVVAMEELDVERTAAAVTACARALRSFLTAGGP